MKKLFSELKLVSDNLPVHSQCLVHMRGQPGNEATSSGKLAGVNMTSVIKEFRCFEAKIEKAGSRAFTFVPQNI